MICSSALKSSPSKKGRVSLMVPKCAGPGAAWSASQLPSERDENIYDLRGARSFPTLEDEGKKTHLQRMRQPDTHKKNRSHSQSHNLELRRFISVTEGDKSYTLAAGCHREVPLLQS